MMRAAMPSDWLAREGPEGRSVECCTSDLWKQRSRQGAAASRAALEASSEFEME